MASSVKVSRMSMHGLQKVNVVGLTNRLADLFAASSSGSLPGLSECPDIHCMRMLHRSC